MIFSEYLDPVFDRSVARDNEATLTVEAARIADRANVKKLELSYLMPEPGDNEDDYIREMRSVEV